MGLYYDGHQEAQKELLNMSIDDLLVTIDSLWGRDNIDDVTDIDQVLEEAQRQVRRDFTDTSSEQYKTVSFWADVITHSY